MPAPIVPAPTTPIVSGIIGEILHSVLTMQYDALVSNTVLVQEADGIGRLTLNRPEAMNAITVELAPGARGRAARPRAPTSR